MNKFERISAMILFEMTEMGGISMPKLVEAENEKRSWIQQKT